MNDKGQVYFNADDREIPEEDAIRYQEAVRDLEDEAARSDRRHSRVTARLEEGADLIKAFEEKKREVAEAQEQKEE